MENIGISRVDIVVGDTEEALPLEGLLKILVFIGIVATCCML